MKGRECLDCFAYLFPLPQDRAEACHGEVQPREGHEVGLKLVEIDVEGALIEAERGREWGHDLGDEAVQLPEAGTVHAEVGLHQPEDGLVVKQEVDVQVRHGGVDREKGVVGLDNGRGSLEEKMGNHNFEGEASAWRLCSMRFTL